MSSGRYWVAGVGAILALGAVPGYFAGVHFWAEWERKEAPILAARVLATFSPPCAAEQLDLFCEAQVHAMPKGPYTFVLVNSGPVEGIYVRARYVDGSEVFLDVFPKLFGTSRVVIRELVSEPPNNALERERGR